MLKAVSYYRVSNYLVRHNISILPKIIDYFVRLIFSCWFPGTIKAGKNLVLGYGGLSVVVHSDTVIGDNVHIDQCVTVGGNGVKFGVPTLEDNVYVGAGSVVLGPIRIGRGSIIGANSVVIKDVEPNSIVAGNPARVIRSNIDINEYLHHKQNKI